MPPVIHVDHLCHRYGNRYIYKDLNFSISPGKIYGLLGKNGVGKTTLIKILMGFLRPVSGTCKVFNEPSHALTPDARARIGLLFEGHVAYEFLSICQIEKFYAPFYPDWDTGIYYRMVDKLNLRPNHLIRQMSCGQRSQVVLGLLMAQQPELLLLDDYSIGLDAGYRRLFLDEMREYSGQGNRTVFLTSHVIQDMEDFVDEVIFLERGGRLMVTSLEQFKNSFTCFRLPVSTNNDTPGISQSITREQMLSACPMLKNIEIHHDHWDLFTFSSGRKLADALNHINMPGNLLEPVDLSLEDAFIGYTGRY
ncbi:ABC transporter ATP-binding protein [Desulfobacter hydrogenophilus]|uniref:ABC transporter ATP-binding protein n=1 Tax=Desulfobacter hydrogenophilus TaxID=2291 RepID=A0A328F7B4_9BACT|nr:ABC transporter ATP-binding protein [Desulfobacter hydrogenophilus]NDY74137.1 ABC transporter ATP-binding protein [Desulfobacter hydrogenophilus]QBH15193.1 ABC transporter ATP-binding protein [Desulfobacter hydrogenophilus]RAM00259.1 ABC transporter ATP-binding protein [Desulfobacter hydrogenophilus]